MQEKQMIQGANVDDNWDLEIKPQSHLLDINLREVGDTETCSGCL
jgi:hypothetical protein